MQVPGMENPAGMAIRIAAVCRIVREGGAGAGAIFPFEQSYPAGLFFR